MTMPLFPNLIHRRRRRYVEARADIQDGDVLLFSGDGIWSEVIKAGTGSKFSHAGMAGLIDAPDGPDLACMDMMEFYGGRATLLSTYVGLYKGTVDVFRAKQFSQIQRSRARSQMFRLMGEPYGRLELFHIMALLIPGVGKLIPQRTNDDGQPCKVFCSAAVVRAYRRAGVPLTSKCDIEVSPGELSTLVEYQFSLSGGVT